MRRGGFPAAAEPLDQGGLDKAVARAPWREGVAADRRVTSPAAAARQTAEALGMAAIPDDRLRDMDAGDWAGLSLEDVQDRDPAGLAAWFAQPDGGTAGGETLAIVRDRMAGWLADQAALGGTVVAITHPMVIRAALSACLDLPLPAVLRIDVAPLTLATLSCNRVWRLQRLGAGLTGSD